MHIGPALQSNLIFVLCRWRFFQYVFTADIEKMYRQIFIHPADRKYQRILWRSNPSLPIISYDLNTVTYGVTSSAYQAIRSLKELSKLSAKKYPIASKVINKNMYVNDTLFGADNLKDAINLSRELTDLLYSCGFPLRKLEWDEKLPINNEREWLSLYKELRDVNRIKIPRWLSIHKNSDYEIHGFSDASTKG